jgi:mannose-6-phosphate isomerase-like protein (cupin superfamily)
MSGYAVKKIDEMDSIYGGGFKRARAELGVSSFGLQVMDLPPDFEHYPEHDHSGDRQEEVYIATRGGGEIEIEGERHPLNPETMVRVGPGVSRKVWPGSEGMRVICIGGTPGELYDAPEVSKIGGLEPALRTN